ncbi:ParA family protein [Lactococcus insecticola]|uniref:Peptide transporter n=1 Tax=Pseudolactococcus insecticola TaxID=2709158 RepID=A0A6A0B9V8_9LACT|nr:ParA family protein [Lactococcus insecticola]GFH41403.1 peptide transporter [Lactococcus insecticola]
MLKNEKSNTKKLTDTFKVLTSNINKGGTGKTAFLYNFAYYLSEKGFKVLVIDTDDSKNLTNLYEDKFEDNFEEIKTENTVMALFNSDLEKVVEPLKLTENIDLIAGDKKLENFKKILVSKINREKILVSWLSDNYDELLENYDYILIDSENSQDDIVVNTLLASDLVIGVAESSDNSVYAINDLQQFISQLDKAFNVDIQYKIIGNKIDTREKSSKDLISALEEVEGIKENYLGYIPKKTAFQSSNTIYEAPRKSNNLDTIIHINKLFKSIKEILDKA